MADERDHMAGLQGEIARLMEELARAAEREKTHDETRRAMLYMLEDLNATSAAVGMAKSQWEATFDSIQDPLCIHDREMRIVRCNRAYMEASGMSFKEIIGRPYYDVFPKMDGPFISCVEVVEGRAEAWEDGVNIAGSGRVFKVRGYPVTEAGGAVNFIHIMDDITEMRRATERTAQEMEVTRHLLMIAGATARTTDMTRLMGETAGCLRKIMGCDVSLSYLWDKERSSFQPCEGAGLGHESIPLFMSRRIEITDNFMKDAVAGKAPLVVKCLRDGGETDMKTETGASGLKTITAPASLCPFGWLDGIDTIALIPLSGREGALGLLVCIYAGKAASKGASFTGRDKDLMYGISQQVSTALEEARLYKGSIDRAIELSRSIETVRTMHEIDKSILSTLEPQEILEIAVAMLSRLVPCDRATIALADREKGGFVYSAGFGAVFLKKGALVLFKDTSATEVVETKRPQYAADLSGVNDPLPLEKAFVKDGFLSHLRVPLMVKGEAAGVLSVGSKRVAAFSPDDLSVLEKIAAQIGVALENARLLLDKEELFIGVVRTLSEAIDAKSPWTRGHSDRVTKFAMEIGKGLGLAERDLKDLELAGLLHDIGKLGTYEAILDKQGKLTGEEMEVMKQHPGKGADILGHIKQMGGILPAIRHHHERLDGKGYPGGLKDGEIPFLARILAVADTVDAMGADRPYRKGKPMEAIIAELKRCSGAQFDPDVVNAFLKTGK